MQNRAQMKESKCAKDILKCANEKRRSIRQSVLWSSALVLSSSQAKGTKSTSFLTQVRKDRRGLSTLELRKCSTVVRLWFLSYQRAAKVHMSLQQCADLPEPLLLACTMYGCR